VSLATQFAGVWNVHVYSEDIEFLTSVNLTIENGQLRTTFDNIHLSEKYVAYLELESAFSGDIFVSSIIKEDEEEQELPSHHNVMPVLFSNKSGFMVSHGSFKDLPHLESKENQGEKIYQMFFYPPNQFIINLFDKKTSHIITAIGRRQEGLRELSFWSKYSSIIFFFVIFMLTKQFMSPSPQRQPNAPQPQTQNINLEQPVRRQHIPQNENIQEITDDEDGVPGNETNEKKD